MIWLWLVAAHADDLDVPSAYPTLAHALSEASDGDTIRLAPGRHEAGVVVSVDVTVQGLGPEAVEAGIAWLEGVAAGVAGDG